MHCNPISSYIKEILTVAVMLSMPIDKLPQGQYDCTGHVINLPQDCHSPFELEVLEGLSAKGHTSKFVISCVFLHLGVHCYSIIHES